MSGERVERRLAAILAADMVGYSRLMAADEEGTLARLKLLRTELLDPAIAAHQGRVFKSTGDGLLIEFASVVEAMRCALAVQRANVIRNSGFADDRRLDLRIGLHVGDVIIEHDDIFGDGVNIAARLESLAPPGGICVSARVYEDVAGRIDAEFEDSGEQQLKNIGRPVRVYRIKLAEERQAFNSEKDAAQALLVDLKLRQIGYVGAIMRPVINELRRGLAAYGHIEGQNIQIHFRWSEGEYSKYTRMIRELIDLPVELIIADATPAVLAAKRATSTLPIVMTGVGDPVAYGIVPSLMKPGGNITGMSGGLHEYLPRTVRLFKDIRPEASRVAILSPSAANQGGFEHAIKAIEDAARALGMMSKAYFGNTSDELRAALSTLNNTVDVLVVIPDHGFLPNRSLILEAATDAGVPVVCPSPEYVAEGALLSLGPNRNEAHRRLAYFVDCVLRGTHPSNIPVEEPDKDWLLINLRTARSFGITVPTPILLKADQVID